VCKKDGKQQSKNRNHLKILCRNSCAGSRLQKTAERRLVRAAAGYRRVDHIRRLTIRKELIVFNIIHMRVGISNKLVSSYAENERKKVC
jgi:hypothetical protein